MTCNAWAWPRRPIIVHVVVVVVVVGVVVVVVVGVVVLIVVVVWNYIGYSLDSINVWRLKHNYFTMVS